MHEVDLGGGFTHGEGLITRRSRLRLIDRTFFKSVCQVYVMSLVFNFFGTVVAYTQRVKINKEMLFRE